MIQLTTENQTGFASIDKPWLKYYPDEAINAKMPKCSAYEYIKEINKDRLDNNALNYYGKIITYRELFQRIDECARALKACNVERGEVVAVSLPNIPEAVYLFYAISKIGAVANMIDPRVSPDGIAEYINETHSTKLFVIDVAIPKIEAIKGKTSLSMIVEVSPGNSLPPVLRVLMELKSKSSGRKTKNMNWNSFIKNSESVSDMGYPEEIAEAPVMIVHTGGTTGSAKGVMLSNNNVNAIPFQSLQFNADTRIDHVWLDIMPPFIAYGIGSGLHFPLAIGLTVVLIPAFKPEEFDKLLLKYKPNHITGVPSHWNYIINSKKMVNKDLSFLVGPCVGGDSMYPSLEEAANRFLADHNCKYKIVKGYGMTEVNGSIGRTLIDNNPISSVGVPFAHSSVKICDPDTGDELKYNEIGEIYMSGPGVMLGYYNKPEETAKIKVKDKDGVFWIKSGDLGYMTEEGNLFIKGRIKRMIIRHDGFKIFPSAIEAVVSNSNAVEQCCVVGTPDTSHNQFARWLCSS